MFLLAVLSFALLNIVYLTAFFGISIGLNVTETEYFLGYRPGLIKFRIRNITFHIGFYIPIVGLSPIYTLVNGEKRMKYPWEFSQHGVLTRLIATYGGALGLIMAGVIMSIAQLYYATDFVITKEEINRHGIYASPQAREAGLRMGDQIIAVNGKDYQDFRQLFAPELLTAPEVTYTVIRQDDTVQVVIKDIAQHLMRKGQPFMSPRVPFEISDVMSGSPADDAGIMTGDKITRVNGQPVISFEEMTEAMRADEDGQVSLLVERKTNDSLNLAFSFENGGVIGVRSKGSITYTPQSKFFGEALLKGPGAAFTRLIASIRSFGSIITGSLSANETISGPVNVQQMSAISFWWLTGFYAMFYAFWNFLPLPRSAFWEVIPLAYEAAIKKKYPYTAFRKSTPLAWILIGAAFLWIMVNDIVKLF